MANTNYPPLGVVSEGTMRPQDLLPTFLDVLEDFNPSLVKELTGDIPNGVFDDDDHIFWTGDCSRIMDILFDELSNIAAPYSYFGAIEGDGACYGFWPSIEDLENDVRYDSGVIKVSDLSEVTGEPEYVMQVSDHGNVTLYVATTQYIELWSVV